MLDFRGVVFHGMSAKGYKMKDDTLGDYLMKSGAIGEDYKLLVVLKDDYDYQKREANILSTDESEKSDGSEKSSLEQESHDRVEVSEQKNYLGCEEGDANTRILRIEFPVLFGNKSVLCYFGMLSMGNELFILLEETFGFKDGQYELKWAGTASRIEGHDRLSNYMTEPITDIKLVVSTIGGGKRGYSDGSSKFNIDNKKKLLNESIQTFYVKAQMNQNQLSQNVVATLQQISQATQTSPKSVATQIFNSMTNDSLKKLPV